MIIVADENIPYVKEAFEDFGEVKTFPGRQISNETLKDASILLVRSVTSVDKTLLNDTPVKFVASATIGIDHVDTAYLKDNFIGFAYSPACNANSVAEYVIAAILICLQRDYLKLSDSTLGIIGIGNVGSLVYQYASALGIKCLLNDPPKKRLTQNTIYSPLDEVLEKSDIVTLHVPLLHSGEDATYHMVGYDFFDKIKKGAILINTSRGKVIDEKSLRASCTKLGKIVLDVWESEPCINLETLRMTSIATPHIAGYSYDAKLRGTQMIYDAACAFFFKQHKWKTPVDLQVGLKNIIDVTLSSNPVYDAVLKAYPIMADDECLRKIAEKTKNEQELYFDELRKNYSRRQEFSFFTIKIQKQFSDYAIMLSNIGFNVELV
jgi:erythronate-4-phosphate dehydrogenase